MFVSLSLVDADLCSDAKALQRLETEMQTMDDFFKPIADKKREIASLQALKMELINLIKESRRCPRAV
jgi:hypothetical protein